MAAHRYWGLLLWSRGVGLSIAEAQFRATLGGASIATGGTPGADVADSGHSAAQAFDGDNATSWASTTSSQRLLYYGWPAPVEVAEMQLRLPGAASPRPGATYGAGVVVVIYGETGTTWSFGHGSADLTGLGNDGIATFAVSDGLPGVGAIGDAWSVSHFARQGGAGVAGGTWRYDMVHGGTMRIAGTVRLDGAPPTPAARKVRVFDELSGRLVAQVWSDAATGAFEVRGLAPARYLVVTQDHTLVYHPVGRDQVQALP